MRRAIGTIRVFTYKEGVLSAVAHDLRIELQRFEIQLDGEAVSANFDLKSLRVEGPMQHGVLQAEQYDASKRAEVEKAMHGDVLHTDKHPTARFSGRAVPNASGFHVTGQLELAGRSEPLAFDVRDEQGRFGAQFELQPSRWGISQYKALLGAIKLKDQLKVELDLSEG